ncbi:hypothetical protein PRUPE_2G168900 [Prunus persica]|uniref:Uncharacterized protein n=1 Tax=Prunus persica TaxID=3760 RepID=M5XRR6_PRUPE|nr:hypothetical protein PRUPE_2G168900 [Prunus persica]
MEIYSASVLLLQLPLGSPTPINQNRPPLDPQAPASTLGVASPISVWYFNFYLLLMCFNFFTMNFLCFLPLVCDLM